MLDVDRLDFPGQLVRHWRLYAAQVFFQLADAGGTNNVTGNERAAGDVLQGHLCR